MIPTSDDIRARLLASVGNMERFERTFDNRTHYPERAAKSAIEGAVAQWLQCDADIRDVGGSDELAVEWGARFLKRWLALQHAGARTANWMITGPARFPVERNRKRLETEHKRLEEYLEITRDVRGWTGRRLRSAAKAAASDAAKSSGVEHSEKAFAGGKIVLNKAIDRVQLVFDDRPSPEVITTLKGRAFRWSPREGAWQRQLTRNGVWAAEAVVKSLEVAA